MIYSNYVSMEGLEIFKIYLDIFGFSDYLNKKNKDFLSYTEYHGDISMTQRSKNLDIFNNKNNKYGKNIKLFLLGPSGSEGIDLYNVRYIHILDPHWNEVRIEQTIYRAIRMCSHAELPENERNVKVFNYITERKSGEPTTDEFIKDISIRKKITRYFYKCY